MHRDYWRDANRDEPPTDDEINAWVEREHAKRYPDGCRGGIAGMTCEACSARLEERDAEPDPEPDHSIPYDGCQCGDAFCGGCNDEIETETAYYMTSYRPSERGVWEPCSAQTLPEALAEAEARYAGGFVDRELRIGAGRLGDLQVIARWRGGEWRSE